MPESTALAKRLDFNDVMTNEYKAARAHAAEPTGLDAVVKAYRRYAPVYDLVFGRALEAGRVAMAKALTADPPHRLLEVGVGTGLALPHYPASSEIVGIDISQDMLDRAQQLVDSHGLINIALQRADAEALPFADHSFDCVTSPYVLSVTPDPQRMLAELRRVCTPGGRVVIVNHFKGAGAWRFVEPVIGPVASLIGFDSMMDMAGTVGRQPWTIESSARVNFLGLSHLLVIRNAVG